MQEVHLRPYFRYNGEPRGNLQRRWHPRRAELHRRLQSAAPLAVSTVVGSSRLEVAFNAWPNVARMPCLRVAAWLAQWVPAVHPALDLAACLCMDGPVWGRVATRRSGLQHAALCCTDLGRQHRAVLRADVRWEDLHDARTRGRYSEYSH